MADPPRSTSVDGAASTALERPRGPVIDPIDRAVARAQAEAALFGESEPVKLGRYRVIERAGAGGMGVVWSGWDPELGRAVALKLASAGDLDARARARDEGRALARLSHPNVVPIYDVLEHDAGVMLVMELVKGQTLRRYAADGQPVMALVRAYRQAGEGLAAAHAAGLVHRDFKPDNAILGADGRVRVLDFGLAHEVPPDGASAAGEIAGTPRYMAPEQRAGAAITAAADQYALCVALREAITVHGTVPRWLVPILARGTAEQPGERYPSMHDLLHALALDPATRWRRRGMVALAVAGLGGAAAAFTVGRAAQEESPCEGGRALVASSWGDRRGAVFAHLAGLGTAYADEATPRLLRTLDDYAAGWVLLHKGSCQAHRRGEISAELLDRRTGCLARRRAALSTIGELAATVTGDGLPDLVVASGALPALAACEDDAALLAAVEPPPPAARAEADAIADLISRVDVERDAGRFDEAAANAGAALARAQALGYRPLVARALLARGRIALVVDTGDRGAADFAAATRVAVAVGDEPLAIEAYARQAWATATTADPARALDGLPLIEALTEKAGDRAAFARALLHNNIGGVSLSRGDRAAARASFERARAEAASLSGSGAIELTGALASLLLVVDEPAERDAIGAELIALRTRLLGANHPRTLSARVNAAQLQRDLGLARRSLGEACAALVAFHPAMAGMIGECGLELALLASAADDRAAIAAAASMVLETASQGGDPEALATARAYRQLAEGDPRAAARSFRALGDELGLTAEAPWWRQQSLSDLALGAALALAAAGDPRAAQQELDRAAARYDAIASSMPPPLIQRRRDAMTRLAQGLAVKR